MVVVEWGVLIHRLGYKAKGVDLLVEQPFFYAHLVFWGSVREAECKLAVLSHRPVYMGKGEGQREEPPFFCADL